MMMIASQSRLKIINQYTNGSRREVCVQNVGPTRLAGPSQPDARTDSRLFLFPGLGDCHVYPYLFETPRTNQTLRATATFQRRWAPARFDSFAKVREGSRESPWQALPSRVKTSVPRRGVAPPSRVFGPGAVFCAPPRHRLGQASGSGRQIQPMTGGMTKRVTR
jgi:hypothetical protein